MVTLIPATSHSPPPPPQKKKPKTTTATITQKKPPCTHSENKHLWNIQLLRRHPSAAPLSCPLFCRSPRQLQGTACAEPESGRKNRSIDIITGREGGLCRPLDKICQHIRFISVSGCPVTWCYFKHTTVHGAGWGVGVWGACVCTRVFFYAKRMCTFVYMCVCMPACMCTCVHAYYVCTHTTGRATKGGRFKYCSLYHLHLMMHAFILH